MLPYQFTADEVVAGALLFEQLEKTKDENLTQIVVDFRFTYAGTMFSLRYDEFFHRPCSLKIGSALRIDGLRCRLALLALISADRRKHLSPDAPMIKNKPGDKPEIVIDEKTGKVEVNAVIYITHPNIHAPELLDVPVKFEFPIALPITPDDLERRVVGRILGPELEHVIAQMPIHVSDAFRKNRSAFSVTLNKMDYSLITASSGETQ